MAGRHTGCHSLCLFPLLCLLSTCHTSPWGTVDLLLLFLHSQILLGEQTIGGLGHTAWDNPLLVFAEHLLFHFQDCKEQLLVQDLIILTLNTFSQTGDHPEDVELFLVKPFHHLVHGGLDVACVLLSSVLALIPA